MCDRAGDTCADGGSINLDYRHNPPAAAGDEGFAHRA
jgi:hypothetical protein